MNAIIVDADKLSREMLKKALKAITGDIRIVGEASSIQEAFELFHKKRNINLLFLDVEMPDGNGFELVEKLEDNAFQVIVVTGKHQYALQAIRASALDYLLKPIKANELQSAISRAAENYSREISSQQYHTLLKNLTEWQVGEQKIGLNGKNGTTLVELKNIVRFEAAGNYSWVYTKNKNRLLVSRNIGQLEDVVGGCGFFRPHRSHLINLHYLKGVRRQGNGFEVIVDENAIPIPKSRWKELQEKLNLI